MRLVGFLIVILLASACADSRYPLTPMSEATARHVAAALQERNARICVYYYDPEYPGDLRRRFRIPQAGSEAEITTIQVPNERLEAFSETSVIYLEKAGVGGCQFSQDLVVSSCTPDACAYHTALYSVRRVGQSDGSVTPNPR